MKILYVVQDLNLGGVTSVVKSNILGLESMNNDLLLIVLRPCDVRIIGTKTKVISLNISNLFNYILSFNKLNAIIKEFKPDIIHSHQYHSHMIIKLFLIIFKYSIPVVANQHGTIAKGAGRNIRWKLFRYLGKWNDYTVNVSQASVNSYIQEKIFKIDKSHVIYNPVDTTYFKSSLNLRSEIRNKLFKDDSVFLIGYVGRLSEEKDISTLIESINLLEKKYFKSNVNFKVIIVGGGVEEELLVKKVEEMQLTSYISFLGEHSDVRPYLAAMDVLVLCSKTEGLPTVILEAMSMECLIVSTDCGGVSEIFEEIPSFLSEVGNSEQLAKNIFLINNLAESEKSNLVNIYRNQVINNFSIPIISKRLHEFYKLAIENKRA